MMHKPDKVDDLQVLREVTGMIALSSAKAHDSIVVVGSQSFNYLVALLRSGFERVACISAERPPVCGEIIDYLFVCGSLRDDQVKLLVGSVGRRLNLGGAIVMPLQQAGPDQPIFQALRDAGHFELQQTHADRKVGLSSYGFCRPDRYAIAA